MVKLPIPSKRSMTPLLLAHDTFIARPRLDNSDLVVGDMTLQQDVSSFVVMRMTSEYGDTFEELAFLGETENSLHRLQIASIPNG